MRTLPEDPPMATSPVPAAAPWPGDMVPAALAVTFVARVVSRSDADGYTLHAGGRPCQAARAASCLLEPRRGDRVACWRVADSEDGSASVYIVAVLLRADPCSARLSLDGDVELAAPTGTLRISAAQAVAVTAPRCEVDTGELRLRSRLTSVVSAAIESVSATCQATIGQLKLVGSSWSTVFEREDHHAQYHQRSVDGIDRLDAQVIDHEARVLMQLRGENVLANGNRLVKVQSAQIHLG
jgi:hypothetical protein